MRNKKREFDELEKQALGSYVYCLRNPLDGYRIFYIGKGGGDGKGNDRVFAHFQDAEQPEKDTDGMKLKTIRKIWGEGLDVDVYFIRRKIRTEQEALNIEAALIDGLRLSGNGGSEIEDGNKVLGHGKDDHGCLSLLELGEKAAPDVNPVVDQEIRVFLFQIRHSIKGLSNPTEDELYEATRKAWSIRPPWMSEPDNSIPYYGIGIRNNVSLAAYRIGQWKEWEAPELHGEERRLKGKKKKHEFFGDVDDCAKYQLSLRKWDKLCEEIKDTMKQSFVAEIAFDGKGNYMHIRGPIAVKGKWQKIPNLSE